MVNSKKRVRNFIAVILLLLAAFAGILGACNFAISTIKDAREDQIIDARKRDFEVIWGSLQSYLNASRDQTKEIAMNIENDIRNSFNLSDLETGLDNNDPEYEKAIYNIVRNNIDRVHFGGIENNRNSMIVLEGYDTIMEDFLIDPESRDDDKQNIEVTGKSLSEYKDTTYNLDLLSSAIQKIRNHTTGIIAIEPYNYIDSDNHILIPEMNYTNLENVYVAEGILGLKNYQFLVPMYITDNGDIFGQQDIEHGVRQDTHKFIVIQTFNLYDQLTAMKPDIGDDDYISRINFRYDEVLNTLYILGIVAVGMITIIIVYSFTIYNMLIDGKYNFFGRNSENINDNNKNT